MSSEMVLLRTKLHAPAWRDNMVSRPRLHQRIAQGVNSRLTFVSAPAGFGKTTLLAEWAAIRFGARVGWVSLDPADDDPAIFWSYLLAALAAVSPDLGGRSRTLLESPQPPPIAAVLTPLINELAAIEQPLVLVLDDYHVINGVIPYLEMGIGGYALEDELAGVESELTGGTLSVAAGLNYFLTWRFALNADVRYNVGSFSTARVDDRSIARDATMGFSTSRVNVGFNWFPMRSR